MSKIRSEDLEIMHGCTDHSYNCALKSFLEETMYLKKLTVSDENLKKIQKNVSKIRSEDLEIMHDRTDHSYNCALKSIWKRYVFGCNGMALRRVRSG